MAPVFGKFHEAISPLRSWTSEEDGGVQIHRILLLSHESERKGLTCEQKWWVEMRFYCSF